MTEPISRYLGTVVLLFIMTVLIFHISGRISAHLLDLDLVDHHAAELLLGVVMSQLLLI